MPERWLVVAGAIAMYGVGSTTGAQSCIGLLPTEKAPVNASGDLHMVSQGIGIGGRFGISSAHAFGGARIGTIGYERGQKMRSYTGGIDGGYSVTLGKSGGTMCPVVAVNYEQGPNNLVVRTAAISGMAGLSVGGVKSLRQSLALVPFLSAGVQSMHISTDHAYRNSRQQVSHTQKIVTTGIGLQFGATYLVRGSVEVGSGQEDFSASFRIGMTYAPRRAEE